MKKFNTSSFVLTLPLLTENWQKAQLDTDFDIAKNIYNGMVNETRKRYQQMCKTRQYRRCTQRLSKCKEQASVKKISTAKALLISKELKSLYTELADLRNTYHISEYEFHRDVKKYQKHFNKNINAHVAQKLASSLWKAYEKVLFSTGKTVHFKKWTDFTSIEGKNNSTGIIYRDGLLLYGSKQYMKIPVLIDKNNQYETDAVKQRVKYCRIIRKWVKDSWKYYVQLILEGTPPIKVHVDTGEVKHPVGYGQRVGIDIGTQTVAVASHSKVTLKELADKVQRQENELRRINRAMDRSRRATNPGYFNADGTIKALPKGTKREWVCSNHYKKLAAQRRHMYRKQKETRKLQHETLANEILALGNNIFVEDMNFHALQRRAKETKISEKTGKYQRKKRFGKSLANKAPATFIQILEYKATASGGCLTKINTKEAKASQYNHLNHEYNKKKLSQRWNEMPDGNKIQRDLYSAFLIMCTDDTLSSFDNDMCTKEYPNFVTLHNEEIQRLTQIKTPASTGVRKLA